MSNIVNLNGRPVSSESDNKSESGGAQVKLVQLSREEAIQLGGALQRLRQLSSLEVKTAAHEAEIRGTHEYLANTLLNHAEEFLGAWFTLRNEYQPLLSAIGTIGVRVSNIIAATNARILESQSTSPDES